MKDHQIKKITENEKDQSNVSQLVRLDDLDNESSLDLANIKVNQPTNGTDPIIHEINQIPPDISSLQLFDILNPTLRKLSEMDEPKADAYLVDVIKIRFHLKPDEIKQYKRVLNRYRREYLATLKKPESKSDLNVEYIAKFDGLVDIVGYDNKPAYLIKEKDKLIVKTSVNIEGKEYYPPPKYQIPWLLPRAEKIQKYYSIYHEGISTKELDEMLYDEIFQYLKDISDLPSEVYYHLLTAWVMQTYLMDKFNYSPIISFFAIPDRGKSRTGMGMIYAAYRGVRLESLREAHIFRLADNFGASIFFDIVDIVKKMAEMKSEDIVLSRYERGLIVPRVIHPELGRFKDTEYYEVFGPTIIAINKAANHIMKTRSITINMPDTKRSFEEDVVPEMALELKEKLLAFRAYHMDKSLPDIKKPSRKRLGDILKPLLQITILVKPEIEKSFRSLITELEEDRKMDKSESIEGSVIQSIVDLEGNVKNGILSIKDITDKMNEGKPENKRIAYTSVGKILSSLGFLKKRGTRSGGSAIIWNEELFEQLTDQYGVARTSDTSVPSGDNTDVTDGSDVSDEGNKSLFDDYL